jgi:hypothetical protein
MVLGDSFLIEADPVVIDIPRVLGDSFLIESDPVVIDISRL